MAKSKLRRVLGLQNRSSAELGVDPRAKKKICFGFAPVLEYIKKQKKQGLALKKLWFISKLMNKSLKKLRKNLGKKSGKIVVIPAGYWTAGPEPETARGEGDEREI